MISKRLSISRRFAGWHGLLCMVPVISLFAFSGVSAAEITVESRLLQAPDGQVPLIVELQLNIPPEIHVFSEESHFFKIEERASQGLGKLEIIRPATQTIRDLLSDDPQATTQVFTGTTILQVRRPAIGKAGDPWEFAGTLKYQGCTETMCFPPADYLFNFKGTLASGPAGTTVIPAATSTAPLPAAATPELSGKGILWRVLAAFLAGLGLSLTPCVYPMIGITVAVIGARNASRGRALWLTFLYVLGLSLVYAAAGVLVALLGAGAATFFRSAWVLVPVGVIFLLLGLSMFDLFTLQTPSGLAARLQTLGSKQSALGIFIMGAVSALVVGPCVSGPVLGLITFVATSGQVMLGFLYFFALAWGMGAILFVAGSASGVLPKAGPWMEKIKFALGTLLLWAAFYFTRPVIGEAVFLSASLTLLAFGLGVLGGFTLPERGAAGNGKRLAGLIVTLLLVFGAAFYLLRTPPNAGVGFTSETGLKVNLAAAVAQGKPVLLDFSAPWCAICKEIEREVFAKPEVQERLQAFTLVKVDFDSNPELVRQFGIIGPPAFVFLDRAGNLEGPIIVTGTDLRQRLGLKAGE